MAQVSASAADQQFSNGRKPHFYEVYNSLSCSHRLKIPVRFVRHMEGIKSGSVLLMSPSGNIWYVVLVQQSEGLFFDSGWPDFVRDHYIENGDLLVFRYDGELHFTVQVFDGSRCEKEAAFRAECSHYHGILAKSMEQKRKRDEVSSNKLYDDVPKKSRAICAQIHEECRDTGALVCMSHNRECQRKGPITSLVFEEAKSLMTVKSEEVESTKGIKYLQISPTLSCELDACRNQPEVAVGDRTGKEDDFKMHNQGSVSIFSTSDEEKKVAQSFISSFPFFVRIMKRFNTSGSYTLNIPYQFSMAYLPKFKTEIVLHNSKGQSWVVNSVPQTRVHTSHTFCGGWLAFVRDNDIKLGDVCIFELINNCEFNVHIHGTGREEPNREGVTVAFDGISAGYAVTPKGISEDRSQVSRGNSSTDLSKGTKEKARKKVSKTCQESVLSPKERENASALKRFATAALWSLSKASHDNTETGSRSIYKGDDSGSQARGGLRTLLALDEQKAARSFTSGFPNFVRIMKKFNVCGSYTLKIPYKFSVEHLPNCKTEILLRSSKGQCWTVNSVPDSRGRMAHTFCGGWMAFVRDNDIKMGDICIFELVGKYEMHVHISGARSEGLENQNTKSINDLLSSSVTSNHLSS